MKHIRAESAICWLLIGSLLGAVPELLFEKRELIPALQQLITSCANFQKPTNNIMLTKLSCSLL